MSHELPKSPRFSWFSLLPSRMFTKIRQKVLLLIFVLCGTSLYVFGQSYSIRSITSNDGLSQGSINAIYRDSYGFMWFGTHDGLNKYDNYDFTVFRPDLDDSTSISTSIVHDIVGDVDDNLWIGTWGSGLSYFDRSVGTFKTYRAADNESQTISSDYVDYLYIDKSDQLWVGHINGVDIINLKTGAFSVESHKYQITSDGSQRNVELILSIYEDFNGHMWLGGKGVLLKLNHDRTVAEEYLLEEEVLIQSIIQDVSGKIIIASTSGLYVLVNESGVSGLKRFNSDRHKALAIDQKGRLLAGGLLIMRYPNES